MEFLPAPFPCNKTLPEFARQEFEPPYARVLDRSPGVGRGELGLTVGRCNRNRATCIRGDNQHGLRRDNQHGLREIINMG